MAPENLRDARKKIGTIFQNFNLVSNLSAINNVLPGLLDGTGTWSPLFYLNDKEKKFRALECLDRVGLLSKAYMLADEPIASLDPMISYDIMSLLKELNRSLGITVICSLH